MYHVENLDHSTIPGSGRRVRCSCGNRTFVTPEPPSDPFYSGRFVCAVCGFVWSTDNVVQRLEFVPVDTATGVLA